MGQPVLLLRLEGPLQAWGARARWDVRDTAPEPTKSGVIGLLGCALGYPMGDERLVKLSEALRFGVRVEQAGRMLIDFQTITDFLPLADGRYRHSGIKTATSLQKLRKDMEVEPGTIISPRAYLQDAAFLVAFDARQAQSAILADCAYALQQPTWPLFLGRKACVPTRPIFEALLEDYADIEDALCHHPWSWLGEQNIEREKDRPTRTNAYIEDVVGDLIRQDAVQMNAVRQFGFRNARRITVDFARKGAST